MLRVHTLNLPKDITNIEILPLSDLHVGDAAFDRQCFLQYIRYVEAEPNRYILLNGDILNNATKSSVSDIYEETLNPRDQIKETAIMLRPVRERILGIVSGNHERRTDKEVGISPVEMLSDKLDVPYFGIEVLLKFKFGLSKRKNDRQLYYTLYATHGWGGGRTRGAKVNNLERLSQIVLCDVYCMAHVHAQVSFPSMIYTPERQCDVVTERTMWFVNSGSFLKRGSGYAAAKGYPPTVMGCPVIELSGREHKVMVTMGRI